MTKLESILQVARDDLVRRHNFFFLFLALALTLGHTERMQSQAPGRQRRTQTYR